MSKRSLERFDCDLESDLKDMDKFEYASPNKMQQQTSNSPVSKKRRLNSKFSQGSIEEKEKTITIEKAWEKEKETETDNDKKMKNEKGGKNVKGQTSGKSKANKKNKKENGKSKSKLDEREKVIKSMKQYESDLYSKGKYSCIVGVDEAGRGPLAGPVVIGACYIPLHVKIYGIGDSKALTEEEREMCFKQLINNENVKYSVSIINHKTIDELNILGATLKGMRDSVVKLQKILYNQDRQEKNLTIKDDIVPQSAIESPIKSSAMNMEGKQKEKEKEKENENSKDKNDKNDKNECNSEIDCKKEETPENAIENKNRMKIDMILVDGNRDPKYNDPILKNAKCETVIKGDSKVYCIAAASIIAKVVRDHLMMEYDKLYPKYEFGTHKGYPTPFHKSIVIKDGPCDIHRVSFNPVKQWCLDNDKSRLPKRLLPKPKIKKITKKDKKSTKEKKSKTKTKGKSKSKSKNDVKGKGGKEKTRVKRSKIIESDNDESDKESMKSMTKSKEKTAILEQGTKQEENERARLSSDDEPSECSETSQNENENEKENKRQNKRQNKKSKIQSQHKFTMMGFLKSQHSSHNSN